MNIPFQSIDWHGIDRTEHRGEQGVSYWQTFQLGGLRIRKVEYKSGYLADHWCRKGHIVHCLRGSFTSELQGDEEVLLRAGDTYVVSDEMSSHRSRAVEDVELLIIDGDFLAWQGAGLLPDQLETERLTLDIIRIPDAPFLRQLVNTPGWLRFIGDRNIHSDADAVRYIQRMTVGADATVHLIRLKETNEPIGITTLIRRAWLESPDIGFALLPEYEGNGYAHEASAALIKRLSGQKLLPELFAITLPENASSIRLLERLGLRQHRRQTVDGEALLIFRRPL